VARNVLTGEVKYFLSNRVPGRYGWTLRMILRIAFGRWPSEDVESGELLTTEQVRRAVGVGVAAVTLSPRTRYHTFQAEADRQAYDAACNARAGRSHRQKRRRQFDGFGINPDYTNPSHTKITIIRPCSMRTWHCPISSEH
jgi:hypothetical protein